MKRVLVPLAEGKELPRAGPFPPGRVAAASDLYDGEVRSVDAAVGELLAMLGARGLDGGTLSVVLSDHGEELGEHGAVGHGRTLYEEVVRVPLLFHAPGVVRAAGLTTSLAPTTRATSVVGSSGLTSSISLSTS